MKKMLKVLALSALVLILAFSFAACSKIEGDYTFDKLVVNMDGIIVSVEIDEKSDSASVKALQEIKIQVTADKFIIDTGTEEKLEIPYKLDGEKVIFLDDKDNEIDLTADLGIEADIEITFSKNVITAKISIDMEDIAGMIPDLEDLGLGEIGEISGSISVTLTLKK